MEDIFSFTDELGPAKVIHLYEPSSGLKAILVVDNVAAGPAIGGIRMAPDVSAQECFRLARAMTLKNAAAGIPHGGGKCVLFGDPKMPKQAKERLVRALACAFRDIREYLPGPDMGMDEECTGWVFDEIGRVIGLPREFGGIPLDEIGATGWGLCQAVEVAIKHCDFELQGARVVVQGFGSVGSHAARFLAEMGAVLVGASDTQGTLYDPTGLDVEALRALKAEGRSVVDYPKGEKSDREAVIDLECEIWIPAARPDVIHEGNVQRLKTKLVAQGANIPCTPGAEKYLHEHGVLILPDFIANAGGVICAALEYQGASEGTVFQVIADKIRTNTRLVLDEVAKTKVLPREAAMQLAVARVKKAMSMRRWSLF